MCHASATFTFNSLLFNPHSLFNSHSFHSLRSLARRPSFSILTFKSVCPRRAFPLFSFFQFQSCGLAGPSHFLSFFIFKAVASRGLPTFFPFFISKVVCPRAGPLSPKPSGFARRRSLRWVCVSVGVFGMGWSASPPVRSQ